LPTTTPRALNADILGFCRRINAASAPTFLDVAPELWAAQGECFFNVRRKVSEDGGALVYGWRVWCWPGVFAEAEHHAVWRSAGGALHDISPTPSGETRILFLSDPQRDYDFETMRRRDNIRAPLTDDPLVAQWIAAAAEVHRFLETHSLGRRYTFQEGDLAPLARRQRDLTQRLYRRYLRRNDPCPCNSGRKVKKCCGLESAIAMREPPNAPWLRREG
jgi:hypothetical protein